MAEQRMSVVWQDANGQQTVRSISTAFGGSTILGDLFALSNAAPFQYWEGTLVTPSDTPSTNPYLSARQVAYLTFRDAANNTARLALVSPHSSIFLSDGVTVDPSAISTLITDCIGNLMTAAGTTVTVFVSGVLAGGAVNN